MSRAWCIVLLAVAPALWAGSEQAAEAREPRKAVGPWWVVARGGGYTLGSMFGSSGGYLRPVDGSPEWIGLEIQDGPLYGVGGGRWLNRWLAIEASFSRFDVEMRGNDFFDPSGVEESVRIGSGTLNEAKLTLLFDGEVLDADSGGADAEPGRRKRLNGFLGLDLLYGKPGGFTLAEEGRSLLGVVEVETRSALLWGLSLRGDITLGRGPWALTSEFSLTFGGCDAPFVVHTDPEAGYQSGGASFHPFSLTIGVLRRF